MNRSAAADTMEVDAFRMHLRDVCEVELAQLHALSIGVGWPHRPQDWELLRALGHGIAAVDDIGRVTASAMWFPQGEHFATIGMVITSPRLQALGTGQWLMDRVIADSGDRPYLLNATRTARRLYLSMDFKRERALAQCQGEVRRIDSLPPVPKGAELRPLTPEDLAEAAALDAQAYGVERPALLARLWSLSEGYGVYRGGRLAAFALCRPFGRGHVMGPVVAAQDVDAIAAIAPHVDAYAGTFLRIDTHLDAGPFTDFIGACGLSVFDTVLTMSRGARFRDPNRRANGEPATYGVVSQAFG